MDHEPGDGGGCTLGRAHAHRRGRGYGETAHRWCSETLMGFLKYTIWMVFEESYHPDRICSSALSGVDLAYQSGGGL